MFAKQGYVRLPMAVVDAKVMQEATFYGLPMYRLGTTGQAAPAVLPTAPSTGTSLSESSLQTASFTGARQLVAQSGDRGTWYGVQAGAQVQVPLTMPARPIQPETTDSFARPTNGQVAHGVLLEALSTRVTSTDGAFDPVYSAVTPDSSSTRPEPGVEGAFFPATLTNVVERATPQGLRDVVVLHPGQFRSASSTSGLGFQQLADQMQYRILYSNKDDVTPPSIRTVDGTVSGGSVRFRVTTPSSDVATATVLFLAKSSTTGQGWTKVTLTSSDGGHTWTGNNSVSLPTVEQFFVQLVDSANNVSVSSKKGQDFAAPARPAGSAPVIQLSGIPVDGHVVGTQTVTILGDETATYRVDGGGSQAYTGPFTISDAGPHTVTATDASGTAQVTFTLDPAGPRITIVSPSSTAVYIVGQAIPLDFTCSRDAVSCVGSPTPPDSSFGTHAFTVKARDAAGNLTSLSVTYVVRGAFVGVFQPVDDGPNSTPSVFKKNSTVPIKFQLVDASGRPLSDATATAIANTCGPTLSVAQVGTTSAPVDETTLTNPTDSGTCFRYDAAADQFIFNLSTKSLTAGKLYAVTIRFPQLASVDHTVIIGVR
jgi:hypothetical protein